MEGKLRGVIEKALFGIGLAFLGCYPSIAEEQSCDLSPVERTLTNATLGGYSVKSIEMSFEDTTVYLPAGDGTLIDKSVALPSIMVRVDASSHPNRVLDTIKSIASGISDVDHTEHLRSISTSGGALNLVGDVDVEKWIKTVGFECRWKSEWWGGYPECRRTIWKTRLFSHSFEWRSSSRLTTFPLLIPGANPAPSKPVASRNPFDVVTEAQIQTNGHVDTHISNDLERLFVDIVFWFSNALKGTFDKFNMESEIPQLDQNQTLPLDARSFFYPSDKTLVYRDSSRAVGREGYKGLWQIFVDTLDFSADRSGYSSENGLLLNLVYRQDNPKFARRLRENRNPGSSDPVADIFYKPFFCASPESRKKVLEFMDELAKRFEGSNTDQSFAGTEKELRQATAALYGTHKAKEILTKYGWIERDNTAFRGTLPGSSTLQFDRRFFLPWDTLPSFKQFFSLSEKEKNCVDRLARRRSGSILLIRPFDDVGSCMDDKPLSEAQNSILNEIQANRLSQNEVNTVTAADFGAPVENAAYRGWYYCYRNPRMCVGRDQMMWWQQPSTYDGRGGSHKGIDLIGGTFTGATPIFAVTKGRLVFSDRDSGGWGNALIIPFEVDKISYFAVYAHLPASAKSLDGRSVTKGAPIGTTGCSGNSGDGNGNCNSYCFWSGQDRTDEHLHFEILKKTETGNEPVDPVDFLKLTVAKDGRQFRAKCEKIDSLASTYPGAERRLIMNTLR